ncbi:AI-2E family transporter [Jiangella mangrovi]|uniref:Putative PurR-regulated permease PerM n=1 Tax=Jiangella mangrovi TaxID=1524084 RepID=A0A7W9GL51_9ACTN|nr:AI-2E family transporter [Jiangella mangrovi]MBB5785790.1 putative PurR-regulated permease PerM [Jiangella mangrovi]
MTRWLSDARQRLAQAAAAGQQAAPPGGVPGALPPAEGVIPSPDGTVPPSAGLVPEPVAPVPGPVPPPPAEVHAPRPPDQHPVPRVVRDAADWSWRLIVIAAAVAGVGWLAWELRVVIFPLVAGLLLAAGLQPLVRRLCLAGWRRGPAAAVVFVAFLLVVVGSLTLVGNAVGGQFEDVVDQAEEGLQEVRNWLAGPPFSIDEAQLDGYIDRAVAVFQDDSSVTEQAATAATVAIEILVGLALALFALIFFLYDGERIWTWLVRLFPARARARAAAAGDVAWLTLGQYIRGTVLVALFDAVAITVLLFILQVPLALPLGVLVFFGAFVPLIGAFVTGTVAVLVALVTQGLLIAIVVLAGLIVVQQIESNVFQPFILGRMVRVHPLAVAVAVAIGTLAGSIIGAIIAVPIVALVNTVGSYLASTREQSGPAPPG